MGDATLEHLLRGQQRSSGQDRLALVESPTACQEGHLPWGEGQPNRLLLICAECSLDSEDLAR